VRRLGSVDSRRAIYIKTRFAAAALNRPHKRRGGAFFKIKPERYL
jgi:hypothetical protein